MDVSVQHKEDKHLLQRTDARLRVAYEGATPSRNTLREQVAHALKVPADHVIVRNITTEFGRQAVIVEASAYKDAKALEQFEPKFQKKRHGMMKEEAK